MSSTSEERGFLKSLFLGEIESEAILPYPSPPAEDEEILPTLTDSFVRYASKHIDASIARHIIPETC